jgi:hypothetical protein
MIITRGDREEKYIVKNFSLEMNLLTALRSLLVIKGIFIDVGLSLGVSKPVITDFQSRNFFLAFPR